MAELVDNIVDVEAQNWVLTVSYCFTAKPQYQNCRSADQLSM